MDSQKWLDYSSYRRFPLSIGYWLEGTKLCREEKRLARRFDLSTCTTEAELETLRSFDSARQTDWFPNGVDADFFSPTEDPYDPNQICFIGRMDYYPNQQAMLNFCRNVLPIIHARRPATKLTIVGAEPSDEIRRLAATPGVAVTGTVPDVRDYVRGSALTVAPLSIARGTQNKILESMAMGVPVICSKNAAGGVDAVPGQHFLVAESPEQYAESIIRLLESLDDRHELSIAARQRVLSSHSWVASMGKLDSIISAVVRPAS
jgi:sugar transferase (PEP-CTERM/EpsH1 system associated)